MAEHPAQGTPRPAAVIRTCLPLLTPPGPASLGRSFCERRPIGRNLLQELSSPQQRGPEWEPRERVLVGARGRRQKGAGMGKEACTWASGLAGNLVTNLFFLLLFNGRVLEPDGAGAEAARVQRKARWARDGL